MPLSGSEYHHQTYAFQIADPSQVGEVRRFALSCCAKLEFDEVRQGRVAIIVNELGANLVKYAKGGKLLIRFSSGPTPQGIEVLAIDEGPGIANVAEALRDGYSTGSSPGTGLGSVNRQANAFDIYSTLGQGTIVFADVQSKKSQVESKFDIGAISLPIKDEVLCGDAWCFYQVGHRFSVIVCDGLGHGPMAHAAAVAAIDEFKKENHQATPNTLELIHKRLHGTRGAAVFLAEFQENGPLRALGVGNIQAVIQKTTDLKSLLSQNGTAGLRIPTLKTFPQEWDGTGYFILHSDGIKSRWDLTKYQNLFGHHPAIVAGIFYRDFNRNTDDMTVVVVGKKI